MKFNAAHLRRTADSAFGEEIMKKLPLLMPEKIDTSRSMPFRFATKRSDFVLWKNGPIWPLCRLVGRITKVIFENNKLFWFLGHFCSLGAWTLTKHIFFLFSEWRMIFLRPWESFQLLQPAKFYSFLGPYLHLRICPFFLWYISQNL